MNFQTTSNQPEADQVAHMFQEILSTLPSGCAVLQRKEEGKKAPAEVSIIPSNAASAEFGAMFFGGTLYAAFFGRDSSFTTYESPWELQLTLSDGFETQLGVLKKMCEAVVSGSCEHRITTFSLLGTVRASDGSTFRIRNIPIYHPRRLRRTVIYEPYDPGAQSVAPTLSAQSV